MATRRRRGVAPALSAIFVAAASLAPGPAAHAATDPVPAPLPGTVVEEFRGTPADAAESLWYLDALNITKAQQVTKGAGVHVCLIDTELNPTNPALAGVRWGAHWTMTDATTGSHGTIMAGALASPGARGFRGVAPEVTIDRVGYLVGFGSHQSRPHDQEKDLEDAFQWCGAHGAKVINLSMATNHFFRALAWAQANDIVVVKGTGNEGKSPLELDGAAFGALLVAGTDRTLKGDSFSNRGGYHQQDAGVRDSYDRAGVSVEGPSTDHDLPNKDGLCAGFLFPTMQDGVYANACGTSYATAVVSGVVALVRAAHPELDAANVVNRIVRTAKKPPNATASDPVPSPRYGFGIVDAYAAVTASVPHVDENPLGSEYTGGRGVWDPAVVPQRAEPPVGARFTGSPHDLEVGYADQHTVRPTPMPGASESAAALAAASSTASPSGSASTSGAASPSSTSSGSSAMGWGIGAGVIGLVAAAAGLLALRSRRS